jgi:hypothetical protein
MREEFVNPFLAPAISVWEKELGETLKVAGRGRFPTSSPQTT